MTDEAPPVEQPRDDVARGDDPPRSDEQPRSDVARDDGVARGDDPPLSDELPRDDEPTAADYGAPMPARPGFEHRPTRHGLIGPFGGRQLGAGLLIVVVVTLLLLAATTPLGRTGALGVSNPRATPFIVGPAPSEGLHPGQLAPDFSITKADGTTLTLSDLQGRPVSLAGLLGHAVWVNFWTSWCPPCQVEVPVLREIDATYRSKGLVIVGVSVQESNTQDVAAYAAKYGLTYTIAADLTGAFFRLYRANALPTHVFIRPDGVIRDVIVDP
ncbi:MAG TPA: TlpA disulfide reductase family protein, partial [Candidatus Acidoferrum sp.]|nr:TlpA disulfide reductase family protein [Candidatus Acidoferrum sp.]